MTALMRSFYAMRSAAAVAAALAFAHGATVAAELPVPRAVIYPGDVISEAALVEQDVRAPGHLPVVTTRGDVVGKVAKRTLVPGKPIPLNALRAAEVVAQGKTYRIEYAEVGLVISSYAVAISSGGVGDIVSLRNPDSGMVVRGTVTEQGTVRMGQR